MFDGIILVDKPKGWTSFDVVAKVRGILTKQIRHLHAARGFCMEGQHKESASRAERRTNQYGERAAQPSDAVMHSKNRGDINSVDVQSIGCKCRVKVGHAGTLDPLATGLLIILVGDYCKRAQEFSKLDKIYQVEIKLGQTSTTDDEEGEKTTVSTKKPDSAAVIAAVNSFIGTISQMPPIFSAIKIDGKRAYKQARAGKEVIMQPRTVSIYSISDIDYSFPVVKFKAYVSSGTYIRSLARDIGDKLGTGAYMSNLRRTSTGDYQVASAYLPTEPDLLEFLVN